MILLQKFIFYIADQINFHRHPHRSLIEPSEMDSLHNFSYERAVAHVRSRHAIKISTIPLFGGDRKQFASVVMRE